MCFSGFAERDREQKCEHDTADIQNQRLSLKCWSGFVGLPKERANDCADAKREAIRRSSGTALHVIWIDLLDDSVRNHRGAGPDAEEEGTQSNRQKGWKAIIWSIIASITIMPSSSRLFFGLSDLPASQAQGIRRPSPS
jgi:hypothetical protein